MDTDAHAPYGGALLPEHGSSRDISVHVAQITDRPGVVRALVYNGTDEELAYGATSFSLQKNWLWIIWLPYLDFKDFLFGAKMRAVTPVELLLRMGGRAERYLPRFGKSAPPGRYRVCFRYQVRRSTEEQCVCSTPFWLS